MDIRYMERICIGYLGGAELSVRTLVFPQLHWNCCRRFELSYCGTTRNTVSLWKGTLCLQQSIGQIRQDLHHTSTTHFIRSEMIVLNSKGSGWNPDVRINYAPDELTRLRTVDSCQPASFLWILCCDRVG
jgi:hypothetical protein